MSLLSMQIARPAPETYSRQLINFFLKPVDNSPLIVFRIIFGLLIFLETAGAVLTGWVKETFIDPTVTFPFIGFEWLQPLPGYWMYVYYSIMACLGIMVMLGLYYRWSMLAFTLLWWATYLMQKSHYNNHYYLLILLCLLMLCVPANRYTSVDARRNPAIKSISCPNLCLWIFIIQFGIVFTFAALAKIQPDWLSARPLDMWFGGRADYPVLGPLFELPWFKWVVAYGGILFDLLVVPLLLWKPTRKLAFVASLFFHLFNSAVFQIGVFPYLMIGATVLFFPGETIRKLFLKSKPPFTEQAYTRAERPAVNYLFTGALLFYFLLQLLLPLRHLMYPGNVNWTEEGHRMSWRMMLRSKSGYVYFTVKDRATNETWDVAPEKYLTYSQSSTMATHPDMIWQFSQYLKKMYAEEGRKNVEIYAVGKASLNGRPFKPLINRAINLAQVPWQPFSHTSWILPLEE